MNDELNKDRLGKIIMLAKKGEGGEKANAIRMVKSLCKKYGLNFDDVMSENNDIAEYVLYYKMKKHEDLAVQVICAYGLIESHQNVSINKYRKALIWNTTKEKYIETLNAFPVLARLYEKEKAKLRKAMFYGFLEKHDLWNPYPQESKNKKTTKEEMDGASLKMWRDFYPDAEIIGLDIKEPQTIPGVKWLKMDATDPESVALLGEFDVIIDDGSHMTADQQKSFELLFENNLKKGGLYIMEDLHTSFMPNYVNSAKTTYEILQERGDVIFWAKDGKIEESFTAIIKKQ